jgi:hypothetical protein
MDILILEHAGTSAAEMLPTLFRIRSQSHSLQQIRFEMLIVKGFRFYGRSSMLHFRVWPNKYPLLVIVFNHFIAVSHCYTLYTWRVRKVKIHHV